MMKVFETRKHIKKLHENISIFNGNKFYSICEINNDIKSLEKNKNLKFILNNLVDDNTTVRYFLNDVNTKESMRFFDFSLPSLRHAVRLMIMLSMDIRKEQDIQNQQMLLMLGIQHCGNIISKTLKKYSANFKKYKTLGCLRKI